MGNRCDSDNKQKSDPVGGSKSINRKTSDSGLSQVQKLRFIFIRFAAQQGAKKKVPSSAQSSVSQAF